MAKILKNKRVCSKGHSYYKSSDCPTCPVCEKQLKPENGFLSILSNPARRALENNNIKTLKQLSKFTQKEILALHGMGPASIPKLTEALNSEGMDFKK